MNHLGELTARTLRRVTATALLGVMVAGPSVAILYHANSDPNITLRRTPKGIEVRLSSGSVPYSVWTEPALTESSPLERGAATANFNRTVDKQFMIVGTIVYVLRPPSHGRIPIRDTGEATLICPERVLPKSSIAPPRVQSELVTKDTAWLVRVEDLGEIVVCGRVAESHQILSAGGAAANIQLIALASGDEPLLRQAANAIKSWADLISGESRTRSGAIQIIVSESQKLHEAADIVDRRDVGSNLIVGPFATDSEEFRHQLAAALVRRNVTSECANLPRIALNGKVALAADRILHRTAPVGRSKEIACDEILCILPMLRTLTDPRASHESIEQIAPKIGVYLHANSVALVPESEKTSPNGPDWRDSLDPASGEAAQAAWLRHGLELADRRIRQNSIIQSKSWSGTDGAGLESLQLSIASGVNGFLEDCGCKGGSSGGFKRIVDYWAGRDPREARVIAGNLVARPHSQEYAPRNAQFMTETLARIGVDAFVPGANELLSVAMGVCDVAGAPWVLSNSDKSPPGCLPYLDITLDGRKFRLLGICEPNPAMYSRRERELIGDEFQLTPVWESLSCIISETPDDLPIVIVGACAPASLEFLLHTPRSGVLVALADWRYPKEDAGSRETGQSSGTIGQAPVLVDPTHGHGVTEVTWNPESGACSVEPMVLYQEVDPNTRIATEIASLLAAESDNSGPIELNWEEPRLEDGLNFVGSARCRQCHVAQFNQWQSTDHAHSMLSLERAQRQHLRNCVACHTVGFEMRSGYSLAEKRTDLGSVGCEACHGPGSAHVEDPLAAAPVRANPDIQVCAACHTIDHSVFAMGNQQQYLDRIYHSQDRRRLADED